jgi:hypothetical protein
MLGSSRVDLMEPGKMSFNKLCTTHDIRGLLYKSILRSEDIFSVRDNKGQLDYHEMDAQRWAIVTMSPSQGGMRPAMMLHRLKNRIRHAER